MGIWKSLKKAWNDAGRQLQEGLDFDIDTGAGGMLDDRPLLDQLNDLDEYTWTEAELKDWLNTLPEPVRRQILTSTKTVMQNGGDPIKFLCKNRSLIEADQHAQAQANAPTLGGLFWAYDEARLMRAQREFFERRNKEDRGY